MRRAVLLAIFLFNFSCAVTAQNWQCLQSGVKHFFINGNGYLRGIRIDSMHTYADSVVYFPFHTPRGAYTPASAPVLDSNGGSWLGKKVLQLNNGKFIFDSYWDDSVIINTQANIGDSWVLYRDTSTLYYQASVVNKDTMSVLSALDSIKTIVVNAYIGSSIITADPLNGFQIIMSKNHGFVQVFDLYTFPYHKPDSAYRPGLDFFLDRSTLSPIEINSFSGYSPDPSITIFNLIDFINPNDQQLHNWNVGDIIESTHFYGTMFSSAGSTGNFEYISDTVVSKVASGHSLTYVLNGSSGTCYYPGYWHMPCTFINTAGSLIFYDSVYSFFGPLEFPENSYYKIPYIFYSPYDTSFCINSPAYAQVPSHYFPPGLGGFGENLSYKLGIGMTQYNYHDGEPNFERTNLYYYNINGVSCGTPVPSLIEEPDGQLPKFEIFPNPAATELTIKTSNKQLYTITIFNIMGQPLKTLQTTRQAETIDVAGLPAGVYNVCITDENGMKQYEKIAVMH